MACYMLMLGSALAYYHYAKHRPNLQSIPSIIVRRYLARSCTISTFAIYTNEQEEAKVVNLTNMDTFTI